MSEIPWCSEPYSEIVPNLWMGGHVQASEDDPDVGVPVRIGKDFDVVFSLYETDLWDCGPDCAVPHFVYRIPDGPLNDAQKEAVAAFGAFAGGAVSLGKKVLVRCQAGYNRSGLTVGYALMAMGHGAQEAVDLIRCGRSPYALCNPAFVEYLEEFGA